MGIFTDGIVNLGLDIMLKEIKNELERSKRKPAECRALRRIGRFALTQVECWTEEESKSYQDTYEALFKEPQ